MITEIPHWLRLIIAMKSTCLDAYAIYCQHNTVNWEHQDKVKCVMNVIHTARESHSNNFELSSLSILSQYIHGVLHGVTLSDSHKSQIVNALMKLNLGICPPLTSLRSTQAKDMINMIMDAVMH